MPSQGSQSSVAGTGLRAELLQALGPDRAVGPGMYFGDVADGARPDHFGGKTRAFVRVALVPHLRGDTVFPGGRRRAPALPRWCASGASAIHVLSALHRPHRRRAVHVVGDGHDYGVDVLLLFVEHLAEIGVLRSLSKRSKLRAARFSSRSESATMFSLSHAVDVAGGLSSRTNGGDVQLFVRRLVAEHLERRRTPKPAAGTAPARTSRKRNDGGKLVFSTFWCPLRLSNSAGRAVN